MNSEIVRDISSAYSHSEAALGELFDIRLKGASPDRLYTFQLSAA